jgi:hypothetical protein
MSIFQTASDSFCSEPHEQQIREGVYYFCRILRHDIILEDCQYPLSGNHAAY